MCLIAAIDSVQTARRLSDELAQTAAHTNRDGFGAMWLQDGRVKTFKSLVQPPKKVSEITALSDQVCFHWRFATSGGVTLSNAHPFVIANKDNGDPVDIAVVHNGVLGAPFDRVPGLSDTAAFSYFYLRGLLEVVDFDVSHEVIKRALNSTLDKWALMSSDKGLVRYGSFSCIEGIHLSNMGGIGVALNRATDSNDACAIEKASDDKSYAAWWSNRRNEQEERYKANLKKYESLKQESKPATPVPALPAPINPYIGAIGIEKDDTIYPLEPDTLAAVLRSYSIYSERPFEYLVDRGCPAELADEILLLLNK